MYNTEIGYCQGMSQIAALLLMYFNEEVCSFCPVLSYVGFRNKRVHTALGKIFNLHFSGCVCNHEKS